MSSRSSIFSKILNFISCHSRHKFQPNFNQTPADLPNMFWDLCGGPNIFRPIQPDSTLHEYWWYPIIFSKSVSLSANSYWFSKHANISWIELHFRNRWFSVCESSSQSHCMKVLISIHRSMTGSPLKGLHFAVSRNFMLVHFAPVYQSILYFYFALEWVERRNYITNMLPVDCLCFS